ncbi:MAG: GspH/FimT family pseudopilin [Magnetococcales bacterium]|nr:GspH/FimT family pseudopilin [Magnetococcales bacterium]
MVNPSPYKNRENTCCRRVVEEGFTLLEMLIVMAIMGILLTVAAPSLRSFMLTQEVKAATVDIHTGLLYARSEAVKRNTDVSLVPVTAGVWNGVWNVEYGSAPATILKTMDSHSTLTITGSNGTVTYSRNGRLATGSGTVTFSISVAGNNQAVMRCITISPSGLPNVLIDSDGNSGNGWCS